MLLPLFTIILGLALLVWSADRFIDGASITAKYAGMPPLLIGMIIVGFGTSAPEMVVSAMAAFDNAPELALGNALGSNIVNTGLILGITALIAPIAVHSNIIRRELPILLAISVLAGLLLFNGSLSRLEALLLLSGFVALLIWSVFSARQNNGDALETDSSQNLVAHAMPLKLAIFWLLLGLVLLIVSSRLLVWGAVTIAESMGVSDLIIGLTIVALGTSLPELAASVIAARKGEHDIALGNIVGSNMFNILAVIGIAGTISPMANLTAEVLLRDWGVMMGLMVILFGFAYGFKGRQGRINRIEGSVLLTVFLAYNVWLIGSTLS